MFSDEVEYQLEFISNSKIIQIQGNCNEIEFSKKINKIEYYLNNSNHDKISLVNFNECFTRKSYIDDIDELINKFPDKKILVSASTSTMYKNSFNPISNIFFWKNTNMRTNISWLSESTISLFEKSLYKLSLKSNKGILSVRKKTNLRDYLFSVVDFDKFDGYIRYGNWPINSNLENKQKTTESDNFPSFLELLNQYKKTYVSFVVETELSDFMNPFTEKTIIAFLTKTMPIVLGGKNYVKELKEMGFYVWNDEFGFTIEDDSLGSFDVNKADAFNRCIENYNKMSKMDIENLYKKNIDKIENNYNIVSEILFKSKFETLI